MAGRVAFKPEPPLAKRLNRNALTVAAAIVGMTVLTAVVLVRPGRDGLVKASVEARSEEVPLVPSRPAFLDAPARPTALDAGARPSFAHSPRHDQGVALRGTPGASPERDASDESEVVLLTDTGRSPRGLLASVRPSAARAGAYRAALMSSSILTGAARTAAAGDGGSGGGTGVPPGALGEAGLGSGSLAQEEQRLLSLGDSVLRAAGARPAPLAGAGDVGSPEASATAPPEVLERRRGFLDAAGDAHGAAVIARPEPAPSAYTLRAGTVIPALLLTAINSELPGDVVAQVSRDVYDSRTERALLIPKGSRLIGTYDNRVAAGEGRLLVAWTRLILPDGLSFRLPGLAWKDPQGRSGATDRVDSHWQRVFGKALLLSAIAAGVELSQPRQANLLASPSAGQVAAGALGQELSNVALEVLRRGMDRPPTITIRQGQPFDVFLNGDLVFDGPYREESSGDS